MLDIQSYLQSISLNKWPQTTLLHTSDQPMAIAAIQRLAKALLCATPQKQGGCGACKSCTIFAQAQHPDYLVLTAQPNTTIKIESVRALCAQIQKTPQVASKHVIAIHPLDAITTQGANALLKTLEEPKSSLFFLMHADHHERVLPTILSRSVLLRPHWQQEALIAPSNTWQQQLASLYPLTPSIMQNQEYLESYKTLFTTLWQQWPSPLCLRLVDQLKEHSLDLSLLICEQIISLTLTQRTQVAPQCMAVYQNLHETFGPPKLASKNTLTLFTILDKVLACKKRQQSSVVATGTYFLDGLFLEILLES